MNVKYSAQPLNGISFVNLCSMLSLNCYNLLAFCILIVLSSCNGISKNMVAYPDTPYYNLSSPKVLDLPPSLDEISGLAYYSKDTSVFAIIDEGGILFKISLNNPTNIKSWEFGKKRDYEDLLLIDSTFYVLVSNGNLVKINFENNSVVTDKIDFPDASKKKNEFEAIIKINDSTLAIICKECEDDKKTNVSSYLINLNDTAEPFKTYIDFSMQQLINKTGMKGKFKPSAAAVHPLTGEIYIISSIQHLLLITDSEGRFKEVYKLDPGIYKQPEGIAFTPQGDMIISNEFAEIGVPNLLLFRNKKR